MSWPLHVTVAAVVEQDKRFLLVQEQVRGVSVINQPAGHLEQNESLLEAVIRETLEETAWHFVPQALVGIYHWAHPQTGDTFLRFSFSGQLNGQDAQRELDAGIEQVLWLTARELAARAEHLRSPLVMQCIQDYLTGQRYPLTLLQNIS